MAQIASPVIGHKNQWEQVKKIIFSDLQAGAFLFSGPEGVGKKKLALSLVQYFLCENKNGCGLCGSCHRVQNDSHEGLLVIDQGNEILKIEEAHKIKEFLKLKSLSAGRFIVINNAHLLNISTSNALLKTLEEPPEGVFFFLISSRVSGLLMTIKSRCRLIPFSILSQNELALVSQLNDYRVLNFNKSGQLHLVAKSQEKEFKSVVVLACEILDRIANGRFTVINEVQKSTVKNKEQFLDLITFLEIFIRDIMLFQSSGAEEDVYFEEYKTDIRRWALVDSLIWSRFFELLSMKKQDLFLSPDSTLFIESLIVDHIRSVV